ncbi:GNAT family N-acetyltransferase [Brachybacterium sp. FME24]|uniref:GNAT family N-acetyltransferase n=1 Tax=Brachybacterium sp. FME24 TaxID=2742605 RepID=UPI001865A524|nr:GNAT family N-acetyltransferase [Brachybacterium sp. FME24]
MTPVSLLNPDDWRIWRELRLRALADAPWAFASTLAEVRARDTEGHWRDGVSAPMVSFVAEVGGAPAGMARLMFSDGPEALPELISMWVAPEARGSGTGHALIATAVDWLASHHPETRLRLAVIETNIPARRLYARCGFGVVGRNPDDDAELLMERRAAPMDQEPVELPTELVARYRAVDREIVGTATLDTPSHLDQLTTQIGRDGLLTPIDLAFNQQFATIDGNHRLAAALRLGLETVPVHLTRRPADPRPGHGRPMDPEDLITLEQALRAG